MMAIVIGVRSQPKCETIETGVCAERMGVTVPRYTVQPYNATPMVLYFAYMDSHFAAMMTSECMEMYKDFMCTKELPACYEDEYGEVWPQQLCRRNCELMFENCGTFFENAQLLADVTMAKDCASSFSTHEVVDIVHDDVSGYTFPHEFWEGLAVYPTNRTTIVSPEGRVVDVPCDPVDGVVRSAECDVNEKTCPWPMYVNYREGSKCPTCDMTCPFAIYTESEWTTMRLARALPSIIAVPMLGFLVWSLVSKSKRNVKTRKRNVDWRLVMCAVTGVLFGSQDVVVVLFAGTDVVCNGKEWAAFSVPYEGYLMGVPTTMCAISRWSGMLLHVFLSAVAFSLWSMYKLLSSSMKLKTTKKKEKVWKQVVTVFIFPFCTYVASAIVDNGDIFFEDGSMNPTLFQNYVRHTFACEPRYPTLESEILLYHVPALAVCGIALTLAILNIRMAANLTAGVTPNMPSRASGNRMDPMTRRLILLLSRYAIVLIVFMVVYSATTLAYVPMIHAYGESLFERVDCYVTGGAVNCIIELERRQPHLTIDESSTMCWDQIVKDDERPTKCLATKLSFEGDGVKRIDVEPPQPPPQSLMVMMNLTIPMMPALFGIIMAYGRFSSGGQKKKKKKNAASAVSTATSSRASSQVGQSGSTFTSNVRSTGGESSIIGSTLGTTKRSSDFKITSKTSKRNSSITSNRKMSSKATSHNASSHGDSSSMSDEDPPRLTSEVESDVESGVI